jgi:hypothetical protein
VLKPTVEQIDAVFANPSAMFMAPEFIPFYTALVDSRNELTKALAASDCSSCQAATRARYDLWFSQQWYPNFVATLNASDTLSSLFVTFLQVSESCPA